MPYFDIPLDIPHAGRLADRIFALLEEHCDEYGLEADALLGAAQRLSNFLFRYTESDENPLDALRIRDEAARLGRELVVELERSGVTGDRLGQYIRNLFECLELGQEGAEISLRAGERPDSLQRPM